MRIINRYPMYNSGVVIAGLSIVLSTLIYACTSTSGNTFGGEAPPQALPVISLIKSPAVTYEEFTASIEGSRDIEIRPQVDGYIEKIYVDEGAYVKKGQILFKINDRPYTEKLNNARSALAAAKANYANAKINVSKLAPLVENNVVSDVQLKAAEAALEAAEANVAQAQAMVANAQIDLGYTSVLAPADGYIGRIPLKTGSLAAGNVLTVLSEIDKVYAYFSMTENEFLRFEGAYEGNTVAHKLKNFPEVQLLLADNTIYPLKGKVETVSGQFSAGTGAISFRAVFENKNGLLRSGNTGKIRVPHTHASAVIVPQEATFELQDKSFVFTVSDSNKVSAQPLSISSSAGNYYLVEKGLTEGTRIVFSGVDRLREGMSISPMKISMDSILRVKPI